MTARVSQASPSPVIVDAAFLSGFAKLRDLLELLAMLRDSGQPLTSSDGLRRAIEAILKLGEVLGIDADWLTKSRRFFDDPRSFDLLLAVVRFVLSLLNNQTATIQKS